MPFISFKHIQNARTGNTLFQYLICKRIGMDTGHIYIPIEDDRISNDNDAFEITDENINDVLINKTIPIDNTRNIICNGFFQVDSYYTPVRTKLIVKLFESKQDIWFDGNRKRCIGDFLYKTSHSIPDLNEKDVVISLRLDDFIQTPRETSDIIPPSYYTNILESIHDMNRLIIVCDQFRHKWEHEYYEYFSKWQPLLIQKDVMHDCALMRDAPRLIHSNSTLCWIMSFLSSCPTKVRYIGSTSFYPTQHLHKIEGNDVFEHVKPMEHADVYSLSAVSDLKLKHVYPLSYAIPDDYIIRSMPIKKQLFADLIPGDRNTYCFSYQDEELYKQMYRESFFARTSKKGGWDCLRHYEIIANGCIPLFDKLDECPSGTMITFPKELIIEANQVLLPWKYTVEHYALYYQYLSRLMNAVQKCSTSACIQMFFDCLKKSSELSGLPCIHREACKNVLMIRCDCGINYTRETFWIGMKQFIQGKGGVAVEYPKMDYLYKSFDLEKCKDMYGNGFTYTRQLQDDYTMDTDEIIEKIKYRYWDLVVYGKVGIDETAEGCWPHLPLWGHVMHHYGKHEIAFLYGGDEQCHLRHFNKYTEHLYFHARFANCFVRELQY